MLLTFKFDPIPSIAAMPGGKSGRAAYDDEDWEDEEDYYDDYAEDAYDDTVQTAIKPKQARCFGASLQHSASACSNLPTCSGDRYCWRRQQGSRLQGRQYTCQKGTGTWSWQGQGAPGQACPSCRCFGVGSVAVQSPTPAANGQAATGG